MSVGQQLKNKQTEPQSVFLHKAIVPIRSEPVPLLHK